MHPTNRRRGIPNLGHLLALDAGSGKKGGGGGDTNANDSTFPFPDLKVRWKQPSCEKNRGYHTNKKHRPLCSSFIQGTEG